MPHPCTSVLIALAQQHRNAPLRRSAHIPSSGTPHSSLSFDPAVLPHTHPLPVLLDFAMPVLHGHLPFTAHVHPSLFNTPPSAHRSRAPFLAPHSPSIPFTFNPSLLRTHLPYHNHARCFAPHSLHCSPFTHSCVTPHSCFCASPLPSPAHRAPQLPALLCIVPQPLCGALPT